MKQRPTTQRLFFILLLAAFFSAPLHAQFMDTIRACVKRGPSLAFSLDGRNAFISARKAPIWGLKIGATFGGKLTIGGGINLHRPPLTKTIYYTNSGGLPDSSEGTLQLRYFSYFLQYVYGETPHWKFSVIPLHIGFGRSYYRYEANGETEKISRRAIMTYEGGISVTWKPVKWIGAGTDLGMRLMIRGNPAIPENFNSPYYSFYVVIDWIEIFKSVFPESKWAKKL